MGAADYVFYSQWPSSYYWTLIFYCFLPTYCLYVRFHPQGLFNTFAHSTAAGAICTAAVTSLIIWIIPYYYWSIIANNLCIGLVNCYWQIPKVSHKIHGNILKMSTEFHQSTVMASLLATVIVDKTDKTQQTKCFIHFIQMFLQYSRTDRM